MGRPFITRPPILSSPGVYLGPLNGAIVGGAAPDAEPPPPSVPGLLMHFDDTWDDELRGRAFLEAAGGEIGSVGFTEGGKFSQGMQFVGWKSVATDEYLADFEFNGAGTIEFFVDPTVGYFDVVTFLDDVGLVIWKVRIGWGEGSRLVSLFHYGPGGGNIGAMTVLSAGVFSHVAVVLDAGDVRIYINGSRVANMSGRPELWSAANITGGAPGSLVVGPGPGSGEGIIDELRVLPEVIYTGESIVVPSAPFGASTIG